MKPTYFLVALLLVVLLCTSTVFSQDEFLDESDMLDDLFDAMLSDSQTTTLCVKASVLNVRWCAATTCRIVGQKKSGDRVTVSESYGQWKNIGLGWVHGDYLGACGGGGGGGGGAQCGVSGFPTFKQCDSRWASHRLGSSSTICKVGCLMSSIAMGMNKFGKRVGGNAATPGTLNAWLRSNGGYQGNLFVWGAVGRLGLRYQGKSRSHSAIKQACCSGRNIVTLNVNNGGHWVLCTGVNKDGSYRVNDSGYTRSSYRTGEVREAGIYVV